MMNAGDTTRQHAPSEADLSLGELLKQAREKANLSQKALADRLKLTTQRIDEIENDNYRNMPGITYARGYIQSFARAVNLSVESTMQRFDALGLHNDSAESFQQYIFQEPLHSSRRIIRWVSIGVGVLMLVLLIWWWRSVHADNTNATLLSSNTLHAMPHRVTDTASVVSVPDQEHSGNHLPDTQPMSVTTQ